MNQADFRNLWGRVIAQPPKYITNNAIYIILQYLVMHHHKVYKKAI